MKYAYCKLELAGKRTLEWINNTRENKKKQKKQGIHVRYSYNSLKCMKKGRFHIKSRIKHTHTHTHLCSLISISNSAALEAILRCSCLILWKVATT